MKTIRCDVCGKSFKSLGFARHRAMHYDAAVKMIGLQKEEEKLRKKLTS